MFDQFTVKLSIKSSQKINLKIRFNNLSVVPGLNSPIGSKFLTAQNLLKTRKMKMFISENISNKSITN
jgi:hypothetical protein